MHRLDMAISSSPQAMESSPSPEGVYGWLSPRISFSTDFGGIVTAAGRDSPRREPALEWSSTEFEFSLSIECFAGSSPADDIFFDGKLLPLELLPPPPLPALPPPPSSSSPSSPILLVKDLLEEAAASSPSPLIVKSGSSFSPGSSQGVVLPLAESSGCSTTTSWREFFGRNSRHSSGSDKAGGDSKYFHTFKVVTLFFRRQLGRTPPPRPPPKPPVSLELVNGGNSAQCTDEHDTTISLARSSSSSSSGNAGRNRAGKPSSSASPGSRILWMNLERCSRRNDQRKPSKGNRKQDRHGTPSSSSFSANVRVAPVLNVPMCMGPVRETRSTLASLRKLFQGKRSGLQRVTWACPGGAV